MSEYGEGALSRGLAEPKQGERQRRATDTRRQKTELRGMHGLRGVIRERTT